MRLSLRIRIIKKVSMIKTGSHSQNTKTKNGVFWRRCSTKLQDKRQVFKTNVFICTCPENSRLAIYWGFQKIMFCTQLFGGYPMYIDKVYTWIVWDRISQEYTPNVLGHTLSMGYWMDILGISCAIWAAILENWN